MIRPEDIPPEVVEAAAYQLIYTLQGIAEENGVKIDVKDADIPYFKRVASASLVAALNAWPGSYALAQTDSATIREVACAILPLTTKEPSK